MTLTPYHAKYFAYELTKQSSSDSMQKLASTLVDAQVDLNPHQVEAALFAFRSPLSKGAILADEVGLGKTIEAALVISQKWAERKRKILIITPANLRKQWSQELMDKFFLPTVVLEAKSFGEVIKKGNLNPFIQSEIIICSYQFAQSKDSYLKAINWDLAVIDEAHRLRNVYKQGNRIAISIKNALKEIPKILLTATPLQNSLTELYGLVSIIDDYTFGDLKSFKSQYSKVTSTAETGAFEELKERLRPICKRTLRRQVLEYIRYTKRIALVQEYYPTDDEQRLYDLVTDYLQSDILYALPASNRKFITMILRRLLASSTFAISSTLERLGNKLSDIVAQNQAIEQDDTIAEEFETFDELKDDWSEDDEDDANGVKEYTAEDIENIKLEIGYWKEFEQLAKSIVTNSKGEKLLTALDRGFKEMQRLDAPQKAIIFTESTRTQLYIRDLLEKNGYAGQVVLFNGANNDQKSKEIYINWATKYKNTDKATGARSVDMRAALVDYFRDEAVIMVATEAAAEGINLQFCSMIINYDMPWNPQRIEQRIGRCHRYGQKHDVVVINFLNKANEADLRVYELLQDKFQLFDGVFGASDEVLGSIESGVDFEKRIAEIYQECRTTAQIEVAFRQLRSDLEASISSAMKNTRQQLLEHFDEEVIEKLKINLEESKEYLSRYESWLWNITQYFLDGRASFSTFDHSFSLTDNPFPNIKIHAGPYRMGRHVTDANVYRIGHPLAEQIIASCKGANLGVHELVFDYTNTLTNIASIENLVGQSGWMLAKVLSVTSFELEEYVQLFGITDEGDSLDKSVCERFFSLSATAKATQLDVPFDVTTALEKQVGAYQSSMLHQIDSRNTGYFGAEIDKLNHWGDDKRNQLRTTLNDLDIAIKDSKKQTRFTSNLPERIKLESAVRNLENERDAAWRAYDEAAKEINRSKDALIDQIELRMKQQIKDETLFLIKWKLI
jgi:ERCC4-related helicase